MASTITLQSIVNSYRVYPELEPVFPTGGSFAEPALTIANNVSQRIFAQNMDWKFSRANAAPFLTVALQQDYITSITNLGWLEQAYMVDINNTSGPPNGLLPVRTMEAGRDIPVTYYQSTPFLISWLPNNLAIYGKWQANTLYPTGLGMGQTPVSFVQQFIDAHGNFLYVTTNGTSGSTQPILPANSPAGTTVVDNSVVWTVADPNGIAFRLAPVPASSGIVWQINPIYQIKPVIFTTLQQTLYPLPDEYAYLFRQGFLAEAYDHAGSPKAVSAYQKWEETLAIALRAGDRETEENCLYPSNSMMGSDNGYMTSIGPAYPYLPWGTSW